MQFYYIVHKRANRVRCDIYENEKELNFLSHSSLKRRSCDYIDQHFFYNLKVFRKLKKNNINAGFYGTCISLFVQAVLCSLPNVLIYTTPICNSIISYISAQIGCVATSMRTKKNQTFPNIAF